MFSTHLHFWIILYTLFPNNIKKNLPSLLLLHKNANRIRCLTDWGSCLLVAWAQCWLNCSLGMAVGPGVRDRRRQSGEASPGSQMVWWHLHHPLVWWHSLSSPQPPHTHLQTQPLWPKYSNSDDNNLKSPNLQFNLTPALAPLCHSLSIRQ